MLGQSALQEVPLGQQYALVWVPPHESVAELPPAYMQTLDPSAKRVIFAAAAHWPISISVATE